MEGRPAIGPLAKSVHIVEQPRIVPATQTNNTSAAGLDCAPGGGLEGALAQDERTDSREQQYSIL